MTSISKSVCIDKLDDIVHECNNTYHRTIKMKPTDVKISTSIDFEVGNNDGDPKFKVGDCVRIHTNIFAKGYISNWSEEVCVIKKIKNTVPWIYILEVLNGEEIFRVLHKK